MFGFIILFLHHIFLFSGLMVSGFISDLYVTLPGSNALRVGDINAVRLIYVNAVINAISLFRHLISNCTLHWFLISIEERSISRKRAHRAIRCGLSSQDYDKRRRVNHNYFISCVMLDYESNYFYSF